MIDTSELQTLAELAVAFAGFSALVTALGSRAGVGDSRLDSFGLRALVEISLVAAAFSIFPIIPHKLSLTDEAVWRVSSVLYLLVRATGSYFSIRRFRSIEHLTDTTMKVVRRSIIQPLVILSYISLLAVASGLFPDANSALYFAALYMDLVLAGILFSQVASSVFEINPK